MELESQLLSNTLPPSYATPNKLALTSTIIGGCLVGASTVLFFVNSICSNKFNTFNSPLISKSVSQQMYTYTAFGNFFSIMYLFWGTINRGCRCTEGEKPPARCFAKSSCILGGSLLFTTWITVLAANMVVMKGDYEYDYTYNKKVTDGIYIVAPFLNLISLFTLAVAAKNRGYLFLEKRIQASN